MTPARSYEFPRCYFRAALFRQNQPSRRQSRYFANSIFRLVTVENAMLNNDLRCSATSCASREYTALYWVCQSQSPLTAKRRPSSSVIIIAVAGARRRLRARLQGVFYARPVNSRETRRITTSVFV